jgi:2-polyprenyl-6-methoxyphenol hydroxylase-like FAD-dependent oxidoreductase
LAHKRIGDHAVVLGGSIAGLLAARVLSDAYHCVTVVDRDELSASVIARRGVPQAKHIHGLIVRGGQIMEELFPGLTEDLVAHGAVMADQLGDVRLYFSGHRLRQASSGIRILSMSRPCLESYVRARVHALPEVTFADRQDVIGLATTSDRRRVTGARIFARTQRSTEETLDADLVVDATGRGSRLPLWLESLGYGRPAEDKVTAGVGYATGMFQLRPQALGNSKAVICAPTPEHPRGAALAAVEGDRHIVTLIGVLGDRPPTNLASFVEFSRSLPFSDVYDAIIGAEPLETIVAFSFPASVRRRFERMSHFPRGLLVMGDAACSFNPIYGQGMAVAAIEAMILRQHLERGREPSPSKLLRDLAKAIDAPWDMSSGADLAFPGVGGGRRTVKSRLANAYITRLHAAAANDAGLAAAFLRVAGLIERPQSLMRPDVAVRVLSNTVGASR